MSYIGNTPTTQNFVAGADQFSGTGSQTAFTLSRNVNTVFDMFVTVSNVPQDPFTAYTVSGNTLTFDSAPPSGTNNIDVVYRATNVQTFVPTPGATVGGSFGVQGNLNFFSTGNRITGDFSNGTVANRVAFQTSTTNGATQPIAIPNGSGTVANFGFFNNSDPSNAAGFFVGTANAGTEARLNSTITGTGTYLPMTFYTGGSERMRIDTSGNVGIGTSSPSGRLHVDSSAGSLPLYINSTASAQNVRVRLNSTDNASSVSYVMSYSHASLNKQASMLLGGTGAIGFYVGQTAGAEPTTGTLAQTIDTSGNLMVGTTSPTAKFTVNESLNGPASDFYTSGGAVGTPCMYVKKQPNNATTSQVYIQFLFNNGSSGNGQINGNGSGAAAFGTYSDARLKENIVDLPPQLENICALRPVEFDYIESEGGGHQTGFIAQEMQQVYPDAVGMREPDEMLTVTGWSKTEARLVKAIQELNAKVEAQAAEIAALKGAA